jgi:hypothetical protein
MGARRWVACRDLERCPEELSRVTLCGSIARLVRPSFCGVMFRSKRDAFFHVEIYSA